MPTFRYTAIDAKGKSVRGVMDAASERVIADRVYGQGQLLTQAVEIGKRAGFFDFLNVDLSFERAISTAILARLTRELAVMLAAGQDIDHALQFLVEISEDQRSRRVVEALRNQVRGGSSLAAALTDHPRVFSRLYVSIVRAGEAGGNLAESLTQLAELLERESRLTATIQSAMIYPTLLVIGAVATVVFLLTYVLPQFTPIFEQAGAQLPGPTRLLIAAGATVRDDGVLLLFALLAAVLVFYRLLQAPDPRRVFDRLMLALPIVGTLIQRTQAGRLARTLGTLLQNGVGLVGALAIARGVLNSMVAVEIVDRAAVRVKAGARLAAALADGQFFPTQTIHLLQLGEETGRLGEMALRAAAIHDEQVGQSVQRLVALLVPLITIVMGMIVAGIVSALLLAMLSLNDLAL